MPWKEFYEQKKILINEKISEYIDLIVSDGHLKEAMLYSLNAGGKRLRPFLSIFTAHVLDKDEALVYPYAIALEFIHTYSLVHDDLPSMDDDDFRRGRLTSHKKYGEATAVLAGDALLTDAFTLLLQYGTGNVARGGAYLARCAGSRGMVHGQVLDMTIPESKRDITALDEINFYKTGRLIEAAVAGTAAYLDAGDDIVEALGAYAKYLGLAFQIADDILDITADEEMLGKPVGSDAAANKITYPSLLTIEKAKQTADEYIDKAVACLDVLPDNDYKALLCSFSKYIVDRTY